MRLVISQPMLMPWRGIFEQVLLCDQFVFYDDVQLPLGGGRGRGYVTRVQIKTERGVDWLSLPVARSSQGKQLIVEARFGHLNWKVEHLGKITQAYRRAPFFEEVFESVIRPIYALDTDSVSAFCIHSMDRLCRTLGLAPPTLASSNMDISQDLGASERVLALCRRLGATDYLSGLGAMNYIDYALFERSGVNIHYMDYALAPYPQLYGEFTPFVSVIDLLFNVGAAGAPAHLGSRAVYWKDWPCHVDGRPSRPA